jgi:L,D-transpeptidase-like protein/putative peptidoglycan binding protein
MAVSGSLNVVRNITLAAIIGANLLTTVTIRSADAVAGVQKSSHASQRKVSAKPVRITKEVLREARQRLADLGYWVGPPDGRWGEASRQGLIAFQKVEHLTRSGKLSAEDVRALRSASRPAPSEGGGAHVEVDLTRQVLMMVSDDGSVSRILPVSTGNGKQFPLEGEMLTAVTPTGRFRVYRKLTGWRKSPLGELYYPNYIVGGIAIHGNKAVPTMPASHGCIRIPMYAAVEFSTLTPVGTQVIVYSGSGP